MIVTDGARAPTVRSKQNFFGRGSPQNLLARIFFSYGKTFATFQHFTVNINYQGQI